MGTEDETANDEVDCFEFTFTREEGRVISNVLKFVHNRISITAEEAERIDDTYAAWLRKYGDANPIDSEDTGSDKRVSDTDEFSIILTREEKEVIAQALQFAHNREAVTTQEAKKVDRVYTVFNGKASANEPITDTTNT